jgi:hypothetical protein
LVLDIQLLYYIIIIIESRKNEKLKKIKNGDMPRAAVGIAWPSA